MARSKATGLPSTTAAVQKIISLLDKSRASTGFHTYEHYHRALGAWEAILRQYKMGPWLEACRGMEFGIPPLIEALELLIEQAFFNYHDILGAVYMELGQGDKRFGQYFTPWNVAKMMAEMNLHDLKPLSPGQPPIKILEPCVGSGVLILAAAETIEERCPGMIARGEVEFYGMDIDPVCVKMCELNMVLHGIGRKVQRLEELNPQQRRAIERLIGYRLPATGDLLIGPDLREGDALAAPFPVEEAQTRPSAAAGALAPTGNRVDETPVEPPAEPVLVAQDLWATAEMDDTRGAVRQVRPSPHRRNGGRGARQPDPEYTSGQLFPFTAEEPPF